MNETGQRLEQIEERIQAACARAGRAREDVTLLAASKKQSPERIREAFDCGVRVFGENKVQEAAAKTGRCPGGIEWHLIGHLQRNKARRAVELFTMIHSVDSGALLEQIDRCCREAGRRIRACIEINISGEPSKYGLPPDDLPDLLEASRQCYHVDITGLMTMPPWSENPEKARPFFRALAALKQRCQTEWGFPLDELSMGMSHDFEIAIEEGANWIRVGTALFGERN
jgi:PLP dependent protein